MTCWNSSFSKTFVPLGLVVPALSRPGSFILHVKTWWCKMYLVRKHLPKHIVGLIVFLCLLLDQIKLEPLKD